MNIFILYLDVGETKLVKNIQLQEKVNDLEESLFFLFFCCQTFGATIFELKFEIKFIDKRRAKKGAKKSRKEGDVEDKMRMSRDCFKGKRNASLFNAYL